MKTEVIALHGFLGQPEDWKEVFQEVHEQQPGWDLLAVDWMKEPTLGPFQNFENWSKNFCEWIQARPRVSRRTLVGYSLGGRLALHALERKPELYQAAVFLSVNPGLQTAQEKLQRLHSDKEWAHKLQNQDIASFWQDWNSQPVFSGAAEKSEVPLSPEILSKNKVQWAQCLENWSLGWQKDFRLSMDFWQVRQIWAAGQKDSKFCEILKTIPMIPELQKWEVQDASHRLLQEAPGEVAHFIVRATLGLLHP